MIDDKDPNEHSGGMQGHRARLWAVAGALRGNADEVDHWAEIAIKLTGGSERWDLLESWRARGVAALAANEPARARVELERAWRYLLEVGVEDPGVFPVAADLVEAALGADEASLATEVGDWLRERAESQEHPWGLASVERCAALTLAAAGDHDGAAPRFREAATRYASIGCHFEAARSVLSLGRSARRQRRWAEARSALLEASEAFTRLGCAGWARLADELQGGLGGRKPAVQGALTPSERKAAELAAEGRSNKEIAAALFVSVHTVEVHLGRVYTKLGVQSRTQIGTALARQNVDGAGRIH